MSILILLGLIVLAIIGLIINWIFASLAYYENGLDNLFSSLELALEQFFEGKIVKPTATDYLLFSLTITSIVFSIFVIFLVIAIVIIVVSLPEDAVGAVAVGGTEAGAEIGAEASAVEAEGAETSAAEAESASGGDSILSKLGGLIQGTIGTILLIILILLLIASTASGIFCFLAASLISKNRPAAIEYANIAGIAGVSVAGLSLFALIVYFVLEYYRREEKIKEQEAIEKQKELQQEREARYIRKGFQRALQDPKTLQTLKELEAT